MSDEVFERTLHWLKVLCMCGTQREVNLNGNGESTLDPQLTERIKIVKNIIGDRQLAFCTNGVNMTKKLAMDLKASGIDRVDVSPHSAYHARKAAYILAESGMKGMVAWGAIVASHNWAGQLEPEHQINCILKTRCDPLIEGRGYVLSEGNVTPCCYDYQNLGVFGHVNEEDLLKKEIKPYILCRRCHQVIPQYVLESYRDIRNDCSLIEKSIGATN